MFSPIFCTSFWRADSTVSPPILRFGERGHVGGILLRRRARPPFGERAEVGVLGDEVGLGVHFDQRAHACRRRGTCRSRRRRRRARPPSSLGAALDAQQLLGLLDVAARFLERLLALHHAEPGELAQFLDHACGDFSHSSLSSAWR
jgi:hypothetical protein